MAATNAQRLLIIDNEPEICATVAGVAAGLGIAAHAVATQFEFKYAYTLFKPTIVCVDAELPDGGDMPLIAWINSVPVPAPTKVILIASNPEILRTARSLAEFVGLPVVAALQKPALVETLTDVLKTEIDLQPV